MDRQYEIDEQSLSKARAFIRNIAKKYKILDNIICYSKNKK